MMSRELQNCLDEALDASVARESRHEFLTAEHLLLALTQQPGACRNCCRLRSRHR